MSGANSAHLPAATRYRVCRTADPITLIRSPGDAFAAMKDARRFVVAGREQAAHGGGRRGLAVGAIDETSL